MKFKNIIDIHAHIGFIHGREYGVDQTIERMDRNGIERAVVLHFMTGLVQREDFRRGNGYVKAAMGAHPERFIGMCVVSPLHGEFALEEFERCLEEGFSGLKFHPGKHGPYTLRSKVVERLLERVAETGALLFIHSDFNSPHCNPYEVVTLASAFPRARIILGHMGLDQDHYHLVPEIVRNTPNVYLDTSQTPDNPDLVFVAPTKKLGAGRLLFGSDSHMISPEVNLRKLEVAMEHYGLSEAGARAILHDNAVKLLSGAPNSTMH
jgi:predicted TIM-barrel fold metal-dependent hydrolase